MKLTMEEADELMQAIEIAEKTIEQLKGFEHSARMGYDVSGKEVWELRNYSQQISAVLYNIANDVYVHGARL